MSAFVNSKPSPSAAVRARLDYPVIDTDVHTNDYSPALEDYVANYGGHLRAALRFDLLHGESLGSTPWHAALALFLNAVAPLSAGLVISSGYLLSRSSNSWLGAAITFGACLVSFTSRRNPLWILAAGALLGVLEARLH